MNFSKLIAAAAILVSFATKGQDTVNGKTLFEGNCMACHSIGDGKIVGPDLKDLDKRRSEEWSLAFVKTPMKIINSGDEVAKKLFEDHNQIPMPDQSHLKDLEIKDILAYIKEKGSAVVVPVKSPTIAAVKAEAPKPSIALGIIEYTLLTLVSLGFLVALVLMYVLVRIISIMKR